MAWRLAAVPEDSTTGFGYPASPWCRSYRESIRSVAGLQWSIRSTISSESCGSESNYSSISGSSARSYLSSYSGSSSASAGAADFVTNELTKIAHQMVSDGYTQSMVQEFGDGGGQDCALQNWFLELDVDWVLQIHKSYGLRSQLRLRDQATSGSWLPELIDRWVRALTIMVACIRELVLTVQTPAVACFGKASISRMLVFVDAVVCDCYLPKWKKLQALLHMYLCVSSASSYNISTMHNLMSSEFQIIFTEIVGSLDREGNKLIGATSTTTKEVWMTLNDDEDSWAIEFLQGGGKVHTNIRLLGDCIVSMRKVLDSKQNSTHSGKLHELIHDTVDYLKDLLLRKSEMCWDPSLRYLFLLNNSYFMEHASGLDFELLFDRGFELLPECVKYLNSFLDASWGQVLSCIQQSRHPGLLHRWKWNNTSLCSSLAKFKLAFHKTYQAQKFWKVPDPQIRSLLRRTIINRVISGYRHYLKENPELEKQASCGNSSPDNLELMLGELFEG